MRARRSASVALSCSLRAVAGRKLLSGILARFRRLQPVLLTLQSAVATHYYYRLSLRTEQILFIKRRLDYHFHNVGIKIMLNIKRVNLLKILVLTLVAIPKMVMSQSLDSEYNLERYESVFCPLPPIDDSRWQDVPVEEWEKTFQFLAESANSNLERLLTWNASYDVVRGSKMGRFPETTSRMIKENEYNVPSYYAMKQRYEFFRDNENDKSYISLSRRGSLSFYNSQYNKKEYDDIDFLIHIPSNLKAIITPDRLLTCDYDRDLPRPELLQQQGYGEFGKYCVVSSPDSRQIHLTGTIIDPQLFFFRSLRSRIKYWSDLEHLLPLELRAYQNKTDDTVIQRVKVQRATIDAVDWVRIEHRSQNKEIPVTVYYYNSDSGYNTVSYIVSRDGVDVGVQKFDYEEINGLFIPKRLLYEYYDSLNPKDGSRKSFIYFDLIKAEVNKPIPDEQFVMDALGLDDDVIVYDETEKNFYVQEKGKKKSEAILRFDDLVNSVKVKSTSSPLWRSPVRMTALCLGLCLIVFGVIYKVRRKRASS